MPKILDCTREQMLEIARKRFLECGYAAFTIRDVAKDCGVSVGTIYTYFSNKEMLLTDAIVEEWRKLVKEAQKAAPAFPDAESGLKYLYEAIFSFNQKYHGFCTRQNQSEKECEEGAERRRLQLEQAASAVRLILKLPEEKKELSLFIADSFLSHCNRGIYPYEKLSPFIRKLYEE